MTIILVHALTDSLAPSPYVVATIQQLFMEDYFDSTSPESILIGRFLYDRPELLVVCPLDDLARVRPDYPVAGPAYFISDPDLPASRAALTRWLATAGPIDWIELVLTPSVPLPGSILYRPPL